MSRPVTSAVLAPFFDLRASSNRPRLFADVLSGFGPVDVYTTRFDHGSKADRAVVQSAPYRHIEYVASPPYQSNVSPKRLLSHEVFAARTAAAFYRRRHEYDVVYATAPLAELAAFAFRVGSARLNVLDVVDIWPDVLPFSARLRRAAWLAFRLWRETFNLAVRSADALVAVSDHFLDEALPYFRGSSAQRFYICGDALPSMGVEKESLLTIAYVGNLGHLYDFDTLVEAASDPSVRGRVQVFIVGDGDRRDPLLAALTRRGVPHTFFGPVYDAERLGAILGRCHLGFNGYLNTTAAFSYKANTYFGAGLPLLNSMQGDLQDLVERYRLGYNYPPGSVPGLLKAIHTVMVDGVGESAENVSLFFAESLERSVVRESVRSHLADLIQTNVTSRRWARPTPASPSRR